MTSNNAISSSNADLRRLNRLSRVMDSSIKLPGGYRIGWDGIIGLIPGVGDLIGLSMSLYILIGGMRLGASKATLIRMLGNIGLETAIGVIPVFGDLFDLAFKANNRNVKILEKQLADPAATHAQSSSWVLVWLVAAVVIFLLFSWLVLAIVVRLFTWIF